MLKKIKLLLFHNLTVRQTVAKNAFWLAVSNFGGRFIRAIIIVFAARVLGPSEWGVFNYAITITTFLTLFVESGISQVMIRDRSRTENQDEKRVLTGTTLWLKVVFLAIGAFLILTVAPLLPTADVFTAEKAAVLFPIVAFIMIFDAIREFYHAVLRSEERTEWEALSYGLTNILIVAFGFAFLYAHPTVRGFTFAYALGTGVGAAATTIFVRKYLRGIWNRFSWTAARTMFHATWPYTIATALGMLMINMDIVMLGWLRSSEEVGWYSAPQRIVQLIYLIPAVLSVSALPLFSRLAVQSKERLTSAIEESISVTYLVALPIVAGGIILASPLVTFLFGPAFTPGAVPLQILLFTLLADFSAVILSNIVLTHNRQTSLIVYSAIGGSINVFLNVLLIPPFGIVGCALATLGAQLASNAYLQRTVRHMHPFHIFPHLKNAVVAASVMAIGVFTLNALGMHVLFTIVLGALIFGAVLYLRREPLLSNLTLILRPTASVAQEMRGGDVG